MAHPVSGSMAPPPFVAMASASAAVRLAEVEDFLASLPAGAEKLVVAPTREAADDFARAFSQRRRASLGLHRASLVELVVKLAMPALTARGLVPATALGLDAIAARVVARVRTDGGLSYVEPIAGRPGFRRALLRTLRDVRLASLGPEALARAPRTGADLERLAACFDEELAAAGVADLAVLLRLATAALDREAPALVAGRPTVLLDVPVHAPLEVALVGAIVRCSGQVFATVPPGDGRTEASLDRLGAPPGPARAVANLPDALTLVQRRLFAERDGGEESARLEPGSAVELFSAPGEGREAVEIARRMLHEAARGVPFDRMAVLVRAPRVYAGLLESAFHRAGIPAWFARGTRRPEPGGRALLALLACAVEGLSARRFAEYLSLGQVPRPDSGERQAPWVAADDEVIDTAAPGAPDAAEEPDSDSRPALDAASPVLPQAPWKWERLLNDAAVIGGADRWRRRLDGMAREIEVGIEELSREEPDAPRLRALERDRQDLKQLRGFALPIIERLAAWPARATWGVWVGLLEALAPAVLSAPEHVLAVLAAMRPLSSLGPVSLAEVRDVLGHRLADLQIRPPGSRYGRVFVGTPEMARGRTFDVVFVPGLAERGFPERVRQDPLLLDDARRAVAESLPRDGDRLADERLRLRVAVGAATSRLCVSYSSLDLSSNRDRLPSFYALDIARAVTGAIPDHETLARLAAAASGARLAWPAPPDPDTAIDAMEHDLATLRRLLQEPSRERRKGRARYLLEVHPALARSLRTRYARGGRAWTRFDGVVFDETARAMLAPVRLRAKPYSVSALQRFATCPYQFYLASVLRLEPRRTAAAVHTLDPLTRGRLMHETIAACTRVLITGGGFPRTPADLDRAHAVLEEMLAAVAARYHDALAPAVERIWRDEIAAIRADLRGWLSRTAAAAVEWRPAFVELGFGFAPGAGRDSASRAAPVTLDGGWQLHGVVDLVERRATGPGLRVTDYKTGRNVVPRGAIVHGGSSLQPVLYGLAVEALLGEPVVESRLLFCTAAGRYGARAVPLTPDASDARRAGREVLEIVDRAVEFGFLPPAPREGACARCDFRAVCGPSEERRLEGKDRKPLGDLEHLRSMR